MASLVGALGGLPFAQQRAGAGVHAEGPIGVTPVDLLIEARERTRGELGVPRPGGGLDQLGQRPCGDEQLRRSPGGRHGRHQGLLVAAEAVHQHGVRPVRVLDGGALALGGGSLDDGRDQLRSLGFPPAEPRERDRGVRGDAALRRLPDGVDLRHHQLRRVRSRRPTRRPDRTRCPPRRGPRALPSRARAAPRASAISSPPSWSHSQIAARAASQPHRSTSSTEASLLANAATARSQRGRRRARARGEDQREAVEQQVAGQRPIRGLGRRRHGTGDVEQPAARGREVPGEQRRAPRVEVGVAAEAHVERLEPPRRLEQQQRSVATAVLGEGDLGPEQDHPGPPELVERPGLRDRQQSARHVERSRTQARLGGGECPLGPSLGIVGQRHRPLQERSRGREAAARLRPAAPRARARARPPRPVRLRQRPGARRAGRDRRSRSVTSASAEWAARRSGPLAAR